MNRIVVLACVLACSSAFGQTNTLVGAEHDATPRLDKKIELAIPPSLVDTNGPTVRWKVLAPVKKYLLSIELDGTKVYRNYVHPTDWDPGVRSFVPTRLKRGKYKLRVVNASTGQSSTVEVNVDGDKTVLMQINRKFSVHVLDGDFALE